MSKCVCCCENDEGTKLSCSNEEDDSSHDHDHDHGEGGKIFLLRILVSLAFLGFGIYFNNLYVIILAYLISGYDVLIQSFKNIMKGKVFNEAFLMSVASIGAFLIGEGTEGAAVMIFYCVGEYFQHLAVEKSNRAITAILDLRPDFANVKKNGEIVKLDPKDVEVGDTIVVKSGERVPLDGILLKGDGIFDTSAITGESIGREISEGEEVLSGYIAVERAYEIKVVKPYFESTASKIIALLEKARGNKAKREAFIRRFAKIYTPLVVFFALFLAVLPPIFLGDDFNTWIHRALVFLVASCPCALVLSIPLSFYAGMGSSSKFGVLVKGGSYIEVLSKLDMVAFDKTGTLTYGKLKIKDVIPSEGFSKEDLLYFAKSAERDSNHPLAKAIFESDVDIKNAEIVDSKELSGLGVVAKVEGKKVVVGRKKLLSDENIKCNMVKGTALYIGIDGVFAGAITFTDTIKENSKLAISNLQKRNIDTMIISGDSKETVKDTAKELKVKKYYHSLFPEDKLNVVKKQKGVIAFVGDGINDAPVLASSDIGISMGLVGQDAAIEASDAVIMSDDPLNLIFAIDSAKKTMNITRQNIIFVLIVKLIVLILGAMGSLSMWLAVFADVGALLIAVLNTLRIIFNNKKMIIQDI